MFVYYLRFETAFVRVYSVVGHFAYEICCQLGIKQFFFQIPMSKGGVQARMTMKFASNLLPLLYFSSAKGCRY